MEKKNESEEYTWTDGEKSFIQATKKHDVLIIALSFDQQKRRKPPPGCISNQKEECAMSIPIPNRTHTSVPKTQKHLAGQNLKRFEQMHS